MNKSSSDTGTLTTARLLRHDLNTQTWGSGAGRGLWPVPLLVVFAISLPLLFFLPPLPRLELAPSSYSSCRPPSFSLPSFFFIALSSPLLSCVSAQQPSQITSKTNKQTNKRPGGTRALLTRFCDSETKSSSVKEAGRRDPPHATRGDVTCPPTLFRFARRYPRRARARRNERVRSQTSMRNQVMIFAGLGAVGSPD